MIALPWTGSFINHLFRIFEENPQGTVALVVKGIVAASLIWALNAAIQPVQMGLRALICEACPSSQKIQATAYASVITGIGSIFGYASGLFNLPHILPWFGDTQFKCLCVIASLALGLTVAVTLSIIDEKQVVFDGDDPLQEGVSFFDVFREIYRKVIYMPKDMMRIFQVQFFAWLGWFPFLFYITT
jgi:solute carrier family 45 protein 1/2/4